MSAAPAKARAFKTAADFRSWLERHHADTAELVLRLFKVHAAARGMGYREALDEALCFGWIDGVRKSLDADSFTQRFTPRKPRSYWSRVNIRRAEELIRARRMRPAGRAAFEARSEGKDRYSFEAEPVPLDAAFVKEFRADPAAWAFYASQPPGYRRVSTFYVMSAKRPETRLRRFRILLGLSATRRRLPMLERPATWKTRKTR